MTKKRLARYQKVLEERRRELLRQVLTQDDDIHELRGDHSADPLDMAGYASSLELMSTLGNNERVELSEIDRALQNIKEGTFGMCEGCGEEIKAARLDAIPTARYCMACQEKRERNPAFQDRPRRRMLSGDDLLMNTEEDS